MMFLTISHIQKKIFEKRTTLSCAEKIPLSNELTPVFYNSVLLQKIAFEKSPYFTQRTQGAHNDEIKFGRP